MNKLGDIYCSKNNSADAKNAIKYYSQSVLINPTPRAFFGIQNSANIIIQKEKKLDDKVKKLVDISKNELTKLYGETSFKDFDVNIVCDRKFLENEELDFISYFKNQGLEIINRTHFFTNNNSDFNPNHS